MNKNNISHDQECACTSMGKECHCHDHHQHNHKNQSAIINVDNGTDTDSSMDQPVSQDTHTQEDSAQSAEEEPASILTKNTSESEKLLSECCGGGCEEDENDQAENTSESEKLLSECCGGGCDDDENDQAQNTSESDCCGCDDQKNAKNIKKKKSKSWINRNKFTFYGTMLLVIFTLLHELERLFNFKIPLDINLTIVTFANHALHINLNLSSLSGHMAEVFLTALPGLIVGIIAVGFLGMIPREFILSIMGTNKGRTQALCRAMIAGLLFDLCNHGLLMVAVTLYRKGAKMSHIMAFLISSPWNSFSVTIMMFIFLGWKATVLFLVVSVIASFIVGWIIDILENRHIIPQNTVSSQIHEDFQFVTEAKARLKTLNYNGDLLKKALQRGIRGSASVVKWTVFGLLFSAIVSTLIPTDIFHEYFGRSIKGFILVFIVSVVLEVCSQGTVPIAGNIFKKAHALGNSFLFLNVGAITNITQILVLNDLTKSKKATAILVIIPLIVIVIFSILLNFLVF